MNRRERVMTALNFHSPDKLPKDLGGMASTGISAFAYPHLVAALDLPPRKPRVYDIIQMLALPDQDVLDKLDCDVVTINNGVSGALDEPQKWHDYDFGGRLAAQVRDPNDFTAVAAGLFHKPSNSTMIAGSYVFDEEHGGNSFDIFGDIPKPDIEQYRDALEKAVWTDKQIDEFVSYCRLVRGSTDRATLLECPINAKFGIAGFGGIAIYPLVCVMEPDYVHRFHSMLNDYSLKTIRMLLPLVKDYVDIIKIASDDWGTQNSLIASADIYRRLFKPYYKILNDEIHRISPNTKTFLHSCGAIYDLIDDIVESGFDVLNPVQWSAGGHTYRQWKDKCRGRLSLWGGGVNSQVTLPNGSEDEIKSEVQEVVNYLKQDNGYVFCCIHNIQSEISGRKVAAMYDVAR